MTAIDHSIRHRRITSSIAAACLGMDPWCTPLQAWDKIRTPPSKHTTEEVPAPPSVLDALPPFQRGHMLEPALVEFGRWALEVQLQTRVLVERPKTIVHPELEWAADSCDAIYLVGTGDATWCGEAKSVAWSDPDAGEWGEAWTDEVPKHVRVQSLWHLMHYPYATACLVPTIIGSGLSMRGYVVPRDNEAIAALVDVLGAWWDRHILHDEAPPTRAGDEELIRKIFPRPVWQEHPDDPVIAELCRQDVELREGIAGLREQRDSVRSELAMRMRDHGMCRGRWGQVLYRKSKDTEVTDWRAAAGVLAEEISMHWMDDSKGAKAMADAVKQCTQSKPGTRVLRTYRSDGG